MEERIAINPVGNFQSVESLFRERNRATSPVRRGLKKTEVEGSKEEEEEITRVRNELHVFLSRPRVERIVGRSIGEWDPELKAVKLVRKVGKFQEFGYTFNRLEYLRSLEALFLLELNRLEIYFNSVLVSVEQAYHLLLGQEKSRGYDKYLIYSTLSRAGYIVQEFSNKSFRTPSNEKCNEIDCIWEILQSKLNAKYEIPENVLKHPEFAKLKTSMQSIAEKTCLPSSLDCQTESNNGLVIFHPRKRKQNRIHADYKNAKRRKLNYETAKENESFLNFLKEEKEFKEFKELFAKLDIVELQAFEDYDDESSRELVIDFDLYLPNKNFKRTGNLQPDFRIITLGADDRFPTRSELVKTYRSQRSAIPLLIASISLSKQIQTFLYYFT